MGRLVLDFRRTYIEMGEELECSVSLRDWVRVVEVGSVSLRFKGSPLGGEAGLFLKDGVFF